MVVPVVVGGGWWVVGGASVGVVVTGVWCTTPIDVSTSSITTRGRNRCLLRQNHIGDTAFHKTVHSAFANMW